MHCTQLSLIYLCLAAHQWKLILILFLLIFYGLFVRRSEFARKEWPVILPRFSCSFSKFYSSFPFAVRSLISACWYRLALLHLLIFWPYSDLLLNTVVSSCDWFSWSGCQVQSYQHNPFLIGDYSCSSWWEVMEVIPCCSQSCCASAPALPASTEIITFLLYYCCGEWAFSFICVCIKTEIKAWRGSPQVICFPQWRSALPIWFLIC